MGNKNNYAWLSAVVESSDDAIVSQDTDGVVLTWNKGAERLFGYKSEEMVGKRIHILVPPHRVGEEEEILRRLQAGEHIDHFATERMTKDGRIIDVSVTISPILNDNGDLIGFSKIARDISHEKRIEKELIEAGRAKDKFLSVLSHELRTPLTPALASLKLLDLMRLDADIAEHLDMIRRNVEMEARLVDDLLDVTRIAKGKVSLHFELIDFHRIARNVINMLQAQFDDKKLSITCSLHADQHLIWADAGRMQQVLLNLLSNSIKFTPVGGAITLRSWNDSENIKLSVEDNGCGIQTQFLNRLFLPFEQSRRTLTGGIGGLGLGLSIARSLVVLHEGTLEATSDGEDRGCAFTITLKVQPPLTHAPLAPLATGTCRVLVVDDNEDTCNALGTLIGMMNCSVVRAHSVKEAIEAARREKIDILVSDIGLPDGTGHQIMQSLAVQGVVGIAVSGFGQDEDVEASHKAGFAHHLIKPVNFDRLERLIQEMKVKV